MESHVAESQLSDGAPLIWDDWETRFIFFTGKGGVGKTTIAAATALALSEGGRRVLVVSTDPASNLDDVFETQVGTAPTSIPGAELLWAMNVDPQAAVRVYRERVIAPYRGHAPDEELRAIEEQLSGQCTVEVAAFDQFALLLADPALTAEYEHVVFDTAPTGHTLRLLSLPEAWSSYIATNPEGASCLGPLAGLEAKRSQYVATVDALADPRQTEVVLVSRPDSAALREAVRAGSELAALGIANQRLVINAILAHPQISDPVADAIAKRQRQALEAIPPALKKRRFATVPLVASNLTGLDALRALMRSTDSAATEIVSTPTTSTVPDPSLPMPGIDDLIRDLAESHHGAVMVMGKGGVGKTTVAIAIALGLARDGRRVHLTTTDPAGNPAGLIESPDAVSSLTVNHIDPAAEVARYRHEKLDAASRLDPDRIPLLEEDLRSPCTEEIAVFQAFSRLLSEARNHHVVIDTAPTGHTLLLLDTTGAYHREMLRTSSIAPEHITTPLMRLQDPNLTRILIVTLAEATPVEEAADLQADLRRAGIEPYGWIINATLTQSGTHDPTLMARANLESPHLRRVHDELAHRSWVIPWHEGYGLADSQGGRT